MSQVTSTIVETQTPVNCEGIDHSRIRRELMALDGDGLKKSFLASLALSDKSATQSLDAIHELERRGVAVPPEQKTLAEAFVAFLAGTSTEEQGLLIVNTCNQLGARELANRTAQDAYEKFFDVHRGAMKRGVQTVIFGNDGYNGDKGRAEVSALRVMLEAAGIAEVAFATAGDGYTWAMMVETCDDVEMLRMVNEAWRMACEVCNGTPSTPFDYAAHKARLSSSAKAMQAADAGLKALDARLKAPVKPPTA